VGLQLDVVIAGGQVRASNGGIGTQDNISEILRFGRSAGCHKACDRDKRNA
jgi:hypothetical protein